MAAKKKQRVRKRSDGAKKLRPDVNEIAFRVMREATGQAPKTLPPEDRTEKNPEAVKRGRKGGKKGGNARSDSLSPQTRAEIAKRAASVRWRDGHARD